MGSISVTERFYHPLESEIFAQFRSCSLMCNSGCDKIDLSFKTPDLCNVLKMI